MLHSIIFILIIWIIGDVFENGYYEQATKIIGIIKAFVFVSVNAVMGARISFLFAEEKYAEIKDKIRKSMDFILLLGFGCVFGLIGIAKNFVPFFFGDGYDDVVLLLYFMCGLVIIIGISNCLGSLYYNPSGKRKQSAKYVIAGSLVNLIANLILIPHAGAIGATIASLIAELVITTLYLKNCCGYLSVRNLFTFSWKKLIAGCIMAILVMCIGSSLCNSELFALVTQVFSGVFIYFLILILLKDNMAYELIDTIKLELKKCKNIF